MILVDASGLSAARPGRVLFEGLSLTVSTGDRVGVVGRNGAGKSTLLRYLAGIDQADHGVVRRGRDVTIALLDQGDDLPAGTVRSVVGHDWEGEAALDRLGMGAELDTDVRSLSGGQRKRVALARCLVSDADLLLLDEPTNHLDIEAITWLEETLARRRGGLVVVTHDRHVLDRVATRVLEIDGGRGTVHDGGYDAYLLGRIEREARAAVAEQKRRNLARRELEWLRRGAPARTRKSKARIAQAEALQQTELTSSVRDAPLELHAATPRLGDQVVELHDVGHRWGDGPWLFRHLDLALDPGERLGIVGLNGTGKSTLLDVIAGRLTPTEGRVVTGSTAVVAVNDQLGRDLDPEQRVLEAIVGDTAGGRVEPAWWDRQLLERFWFEDDTQWAPIGTLSGGERRRLQLLLVLSGRPNVLLLDEPTNDLDLDTLRALEDFLDDWPGALVVVSHDRAFLERTVEDVLVLERGADGGSGTAGRRPGGYAAWEAERRAGRSLGSAARPPAADRPVVRPAAPRPKGVSASALRARVAKLEAELADLTARRDALAAELAAAGADHGELTRLSVALGEVDDAVTRTEEAWLEAAETLEALA